MSNTLPILIDRVISKEGLNGRERLAAVIGRTWRAIERYRQKEHRPTQNNAYRLALACGCSEKEALRIAEGYSPIKAKESA